MSQMTHFEKLSFCKGYNLYGNQEYQFFYCTSQIISSYGIGAAISKNLWQSKPFLDGRDTLIGYSYYNNSHFLVLWMTASCTLILVPGLF